MGNNLPPFSCPAVFKAAPSPGFDIPAPLRNGASSRLKPGVSLQEWLWALATLFLIRRPAMAWEGAQIAW